MVTVCARHGAQHDCINDRAGVACELGDADLEVGVYAVESTVHAELEEDAPADAEPALEGFVVDRDGAVLAVDTGRGYAITDRRRGFFRRPGPRDTPPCPVSLSPIPIRADGGR